MAFRFLHTADWQIGMNAREVGRKGERLREARFAAAEKVIRIANEAAVQAVVLAGDTFEESDVSGEWVERTVRILEQSSAPVYVLPANHDPLVPKGVFEHDAWKRAARKVKVFRSKDPVACGEAVFLPCPLSTRTSFDDPLGQIAPRAADDTRIRIGVAHGSVIGGAGMRLEDIENDFPIDLNAAAPLGLDYLALGHWHCPSEYEIGGATRAYYSGSHEPTKFGESSENGRFRSGRVLIVEIDRHGAAPKVEERRTAVLEWQDRGVVRLASDQDIERLIEEVHGAPSEARESVLWRVTLEGVCSTRGEYLIEHDLRQVATERYLYAKIVRSPRLQTLPEGDAWIDGMADGVAKATALKLREKASVGDPVARRALAMLYELAEKKA